MRICRLCGKEFDPPRPNSRPGLFCSARCRNTNNARVSSAKRGAAQRRTGTGEATYIKLMGRHEHRVVMENFLGRRLLSSEVVHHKDGNPKNNALSNLEVLARVDHMREHGIGIPGNALLHKPWESRGKK